ncbi:MAG: zf-HC2 domain-containing protein [Candidatus Eisenbacteria bacterium]
MITCRDLISFLDRYLDDELSKAERDVFSDHLRDCRCCLNYLEKYRTTIRLEKRCCPCSDTIPSEVPESLVKAILKAREAGK